ncbi:MAG: trimeric intracellular cation channel family protein [Clostridia bacterium]|nr:trimeric intracellular cation channel family protein [Clostridia bacterium]
MGFAEWLLTAAEWIGTVAFAISGAATAVERGLDLFGVLFMGLITAMGGGVIRDLLLGRVPPALFFSGGFVAAALITALVVFLVAYARSNCFAQKDTQLARAVDLADALGLGIFAVLGTEIAMQAGYAGNALLCVSMGAITGCGGGALRDVLSREIPFVFTKHVYAVASIAGALAYYGLGYWSLADSTTATVAGVALTVAIRALAMTYRWNLPKVGQKKAG